MRESFYPADDSFPVLPQDWTPVVVEGTRLQKPLPLLPLGGTENLVQKSEPQFEVFPRRTSFDPKGIMMINDGSRSGGHDALEESPEIEQTDAEGHRRSFAIDLKTKELGNRRTMGEDAWSRSAKKTTLPQTAGMMFVGKENARAKRKSAFGTPPGLKKEGDIRLDSVRLRISAPILAENSLGWD